MKTAKWTFIVVGLPLFAVAFVARLLWGYLAAGWDCGRQFGAWLTQDRR